MAATVSSCGGLGSFGATDPGQADRWVGEQIEVLRSATTAPFAVGFNTSSVDRTAARFDIAMAMEPPAVMLSFSDPQRWLDRAHDAGCLVIFQVQTGSKRCAPATRALMHLSPKVPRPRATPLAEQREVVVGHLRAFDSEPDDEAWLMYGQSAAFVDAVQPIADIMRDLEPG